MNLDKALHIVKLYVGSSGQKAGSRPTLETALVTERYVIATNSHILVRIAHGEEGVTPYLHRYEEQDTPEEFIVSGDVEVTVLPVRGRTV